MKTPPLRAAALLAFTACSLCHAGELERGPALTAEDLAKQLGVFNTTLVFKQDKPFSRVHVGVVYKERKADGSYTTISCPVSTHQTLSQTLSELPIAVMVSKDASTLVVGSSFSRGKGIDLDGPTSSVTPPQLLPDGNYEWVTLLKESARDPKEDIKARLELIVKVEK